MRTASASAPSGVQISVSQQKLPSPPVSVPSLPLSPHTKTITSPSNPFVKHCLKIRQSSSYRHTYGHALVVGTTPIWEITRFQELKDGRPTIMDCLLLLDGAEIPNELYGFCNHVVHVSPTVMKRISGVQSIDSIEAIALMKIPSSFCNLEGRNGETSFQSCFPSLHRILVLDRIQDPGNLGTLLRSAMAFRWDGIFLLPGCCDPFNEKALRASRGASFQLSIVSGNWDHLEILRNEFQMKMLAGHPGTSSTGSQVSSSLSQKLADVFEGERVCLVLGSEGNGLSGKSKAACELVSIPMAGEYESLNVSVAGGIFLFMLQPLSHRIV